MPAFAPEDGEAADYAAQLTQQWSDVARFHADTYGEDTPYSDFARAWRAELFAPSEWAALFRDAGARYVVLTAKSRDGFCLWPSAEAWPWHSEAAGPRRDIVGEVADAVRGAGLRFGVEVALSEPGHALYQADQTRFVNARLLPQLAGVVAGYRPDLVYGAHAGAQMSNAWRTADFVAWLYNRAPAPADLVVNDQWGADTPGEHGGVVQVTPARVRRLSARAAVAGWEEVAPLAVSRAFNRNAPADAYQSVDRLIERLVEVVSLGGNLLLAVGPRADGRFPVVVEERLRGLGAWLDAYGAGIYGTVPWEGTAEAGLYFTAKDDTVYVFDFTGAEELSVTRPAPRPVADDGAGTTEGEGEGEGVLAVTEVLEAAVLEGATLLGPDLELTPTEDNFNWRFDLSDAPAPEASPCRVLQLDLAYERLDNE